MCFPVFPTWARLAPQRAPCHRAQAQLKSNDWCHFYCLLFTGTLRGKVLVQAAQGACRRPLMRLTSFPMLQNVSDLVACFRPRVSAARCTASRARSRLLLTTALHSLAAAQDQPARPTPAFRIKCTESCAIPNRPGGDRQRNSRACFCHGSTNFHS